MLSKRALLLLSLPSLFLAITACSLLFPSQTLSTPSGPESDNELVVMTWNLEHYSQNKAQEVLATGQTFNEFLAQVIQDQGVDILAMQEVSASGNFPHIAELINLLGGPSAFDFVYSRSGGNIRLAFLYRVSAVEVLGTEELDQINITGNLRGALVLKVKSRKGGLDLTLINVHNDSGSTSRDKQNRALQVQLLAEWIQSRLQPNEKDFIVLGDFNEPLDEGRNEDEGRLDPLESLFEFFYPGPFTHLSDCLCRRIDNIAISKGPGGALQELVFAPQALLPEDIGFSGTLKDFDAQVSDHLPVKASLEDVDLD